MTSAVAAPEFDLLTPMLLMPFAHFKAQGRIAKSTSEWREAALREGRLVKYEEGNNTMVGIFVSHTWWYRPKEKPPPGSYDYGAPDFPEGPNGEAEAEVWQWADVDDEQAKRDALIGGLYRKPAHLKWRLICDGVAALMEEHGLDEANVGVWIDWQVRGRLFSQVLGCEARTAPCVPHVRRRASHKTTRRSSTRA